MMNQFSNDGSFMDQFQRDPGSGRSGAAAQSQTRGGADSRSRRSSLSAALNQLSQVAADAELHRQQQRQQGRAAAKPKMSVAAAFGDDSDEEPPDPAQAKGVRMRHGNAMPALNAVASPPTPDKGSKVVKTSIKPVVGGFKPIGTAPVAAASRWDTAPLDNVPTPKDEPSHDYRNTAPPSSVLQGATMAARPPSPPRQPSTGLDYKYLSGSVSSSRGDERRPRRSFRESPTVESVETSSSRSKRRRFTETPQETADRKVDANVEEKKPAAVAADHPKSSAHATSPLAAPMKATSPALPVDATPFRPATPPAPVSASATASGLDEAEAELAEHRATMQARAIALRAIEKLNRQMGVSAAPPPDDPDEPTDEPTWEHVKRAEEMKKTEDDAKAATERVRGRHHLGDFIPAEKQKKFVKKLLSERGVAVDEQDDAVDESMYAQNKLSEDNKGFQMLQKLGWNAGAGLGAQGQGITAPVPAGRSDGAPQTSGLGSSRHDEITEEDDLYAAYRKRMMVAYRHRPNPLNNPRRQYY